MGPLRTVPLTFQTRSASLADLASIVHLEEQSFSSPWTAKMFEAELTGNQFSHLWTAWAMPDEASRPDEMLPGRGSTLIGYVCFWVVFEEYRLMNLAVEPAWRRRGVARGLMNRSLLAGREMGARRALLEVRGSNRAAIQLYEDLGFRRLGIRERYYSKPVEDALMMDMDPLMVKPEGRVQP